MWRDTLTIRVRAPYTAAEENQPIAHVCDNTTMGGLIITVYSIVALSHAKTSIRARGFLVATRSE